VVSEWVKPLCHSEAETWRDNDKNGRTQTDRQTDRDRHTDRQTVTSSHRRSIADRRASCCANWALGLCEPLSTTPVCNTRCTELKHHSHFHQEQLQHSNTLHRLMDRSHLHQVHLQHFNMLHRLKGHSHFYQDKLPYAVQTLIFVSKITSDAINDSCTGWTNNTGRLHLTGTCLKCLNQK